MGCYKQFLRRPGHSGPWRLKHNPSLWDPKEKGLGWGGVVRFRKGPGKQCCGLPYLNRKREKKIPVKGSFLGIGGELVEDPLKYQGACV